MRIIHKTLDQNFSFTDSNIFGRGTFLIRVKNNQHDINYDYFLKIQKSSGDKGKVRISPEQIAAVLLETQRLIKANLAPLQRSMQLYLANKETEFILFRPIRVFYSIFIALSTTNYEGFLISFHNKLFFNKKRF